MWSWVGTAVQLATRKKSLISNHWFEFKLMKSVKSHQEFEFTLLVWNQTLQLKLTKSVKSNQECEFTLLVWNHTLKKGLKSHHRFEFKLLVWNHTFSRVWIQTLDVKWEKVFLDAPIPRASRAILGLVSAPPPATALRWPLHVPKPKPRLVF